MKPIYWLLFLFVMGVVFLINGLWSLQASAGQSSDSLTAGSLLGAGLAFGLGLSQLEQRVMVKRHMKAAHPGGALPKTMA